MSRLTDRIRLAAYLCGWRRETAMLDSALAQQAPGVKAAAPGPIFILGAPRSGTSVMGWALNEHSQLVCGPESELFIQQFGFGRLARAYLNARRRQDGLLAQKQVSLDTYAASLGQGAAKLYEDLLGGPRWIDTTPRHVLFARELGLLLPQSKFILLVRSGVDVVHSLTHSGFNLWGANSFTLATATWRTYLAAGLEFAHAHPMRCHVVRYEELDSMQEPQWDGLFEFLDLEPQSGCQAFLSSNVINSSFDSADDRPAQAQADWNRLQRKIFDAIAGPLMTELGYDF